MANTGYGVVKFRLSNRAELEIVDITVYLPLLNAYNHGWIEIKRRTRVSTRTKFKSHQSEKTIVRSATRTPLRNMSGNFIDTKENFGKSDFFSSIVGVPFKQARNNYAKGEVLKDESATVFIGDLYWSLVH